MTDTNLLYARNHFDDAIDGRDDGLPMSIAETLDIVAAAARHLVRLQGADGASRVLREMARSCHDGEARRGNGNVIAFPPARR